MSYEGRSIMEGNTMFKTIIVEDEKPILELMKHVVGQNPHYSIVGAYSNPLEALDNILALKPDVAFLDVEMPRMNGLELAHMINEVSEHTQIIFTTAYKDYALDAFQVQATDYILKPVTKSAIERVTNRLHKQRIAVIPPAAPVNKAVIIRCFGGLEVRNPRGELVRFPTRKTEELFAYFLCHPNSEVSKWHLVELLWPELDEERVLHNLHNTLYRLKKLLKEQEIPLEIIKINEGYLLQTQQLTYDLLEFKRDHEALQQKAVTDLSKTEQRCTLYQGPLLDRKEYLWKTALEEKFRQQYLAAMRSLIQYDVDKQNWKMADQRFNQFLSIYPLDEEMNLYLLQVYLASDRKDQMEKKYAEYKRQYTAEMGMDLPEEIMNWGKLHFTV
ncbi:response regulator [Paenibacillus guangzhouensis]|uniref:response regulator n=1 Tax=Paenibacillus guangzhouensis TaxID=1473112 RepID=UPI001D0FDACF|nr:response regulator [Paenibacillus guangzhouensis]